MKMQSHFALQLHSNSSDELLPAITQQQNKQLDRVFITAGDFNHVKLRTVLPEFHQHVNFPARGENTLDHVYSNIKDAYKASPAPHLGQSDQISLFLTPAYRLLYKSDHLSGQCH